MKKIFLAFFSLLVTVATFAQNDQRLPAYGYEMDRVRILKAMQIPYFTGLPFTDRRDSLLPQIGVSALEPTKIKLYDPVAKTWADIGGSGGGSGGGISQLGANIYGLIKVNDSTYKVDTALVATKLRLYKVVDSLVNIIGGKLNKSDTASMLTGYTRVQRFLDSIAALRAAIVTGGGTVIQPDTIIYLSRSAGVYNDTTLNSTTGIKAVFDLVRPKKIIIDGNFKADSVRPNSNTWFDGLGEGTGLHQTVGIDASFIANEHRTSGTILDSNISITNMTINGNGHKANGDENRAYHSNTGLTTVLNFRGVKNFNRENLTLLNSRSIMCIFSNIFNATATNINIQQNRALHSHGGGISYTAVHDGEKYIGPFDNIVNKNIHGYTVDDFMSFVSNDVFAPYTTSCFGLNFYDPYASHGYGDNVYVDGVTFEGGYHGLRVLSSTDSLGTIVITHIGGIVNENLMIASGPQEFPTCIYPYPGDTGYIKSLVLGVTNLEVIPNGVDNTTSSTGIYANTNFGNLSITNVGNYKGYVAGSYAFFKQGFGVNIKNLNVENINIEGLPYPTEFQSFEYNGTVGDMTGNAVSPLKTFPKFSAERTPVLENVSGFGNVVDLMLHGYEGNSLTALTIAPMGIGFFDINSELVLSNTTKDAHALGNYEQLHIRATNSEYIMSSYYAGTGVNRPLRFKNNFAGTDLMTVDFPNGLVQINGALTLVTGNQTTGKVWTASDNLGHGDWATAASGIGGSIAAGQIPVGNGTNTITASSINETSGVVKVGGGTTLGLSGETIPFQASVATGAAGIVFGTDAAGSAAYADWRSGNHIWHNVNVGSGGGNKLAWRSATYSGGTATYSAELFSLTTNGDLEFARAFMPNGNAGTTGYFLKSNGAGVSPTWVSPITYFNSFPGGGWRIGTAGTNTFRTLTGSNGIVFDTTNADILDISIVDLHNGFSGDLVSQTTTQNIINYTTPNDGNVKIYRLGVENIINSAPAGTLVTTVTYTDKTNNSRTVILYNSGSTAPALSVTGVSNFPVIEISTYPNTAVQVNVAVTGTINYNAGASLTYIRNYGL